MADSLFKIKQTTHANECKVYITSRDGIFYTHSNFVIFGYHYPTKINAYEGDYNLFEILKIMTSNHIPDLTRIDINLLVAHSNKINYYVDKSMIDENEKLKNKFRWC
jgi:hypothetical protein